MSETSCGCSQVDLHLATPQRFITSLLRYQKKLYLSPDSPSPYCRKSHFPLKVILRLWKTMKLSPRAALISLVLFLGYALCVQSQERPQPVHFAATLSVPLSDDEIDAAIYRTDHVESLSGVVTISDYKNGPTRPLSEILFVDPNVSVCSTYYVTVSNKTSLHDFPPGKVFNFATGTYSVRFYRTAQDQQDGIDAGSECVTTTDTPLSKACLAPFQRQQDIMKV